MKTRKATRYIADCGRGFWSKDACLSHEQNCKCWTNPKYKTCKTCKFAEKVHDSNGMTGQYRESWDYIECQNPKFDYDKHFTPAHKNAPDLCINCQLWETKN